MEDFGVLNIKTKHPRAFVYGYNSSDVKEVETTNTLYPEKVIIHYYIDDTTFMEDFSRYKPDIIVICGHNSFPKLDECTEINAISKKCYATDFFDSEDDLINFIYKFSLLVEVDEKDMVFDNEDVPTVSCFTAAFCTRPSELHRLYKSLDNQTYPHWEWTIIDDSPPGHLDVYNTLVAIGSQDPRVKYHRIEPHSKGIIGLAKNRAALLSRGKYLAEVDHDDELMPNCLSEIVNGFKKYPDAGFLYTDAAEVIDLDEGKFVHYGDGAACGYAKEEWVEIDGIKYLHYIQADINPRTIRYNYCMPNHIRVWERDLYHKIGGHNCNIPVADDLELIIRTFLNTKMIHVKKICYLQHSDPTNTTKHTVKSINSRARFYRDIHNYRIHDRIIDMGFEDWDWDKDNNTSYPPTEGNHLRRGKDEGKMNYIIE